MACLREFRVGGFVCPPFTPFNADRSINFERISDYIDNLLKYNCKDVFVNGTTAECFSLTISERKQLAETWIKEGKGRLNSIIVHVSALAISDAKDLAVHAEQSGADAIACMLPCYHKPETEEAMVNWLQEIAASAPKTPFYYYDINFMSGNKVDLPRLFGSLVDKLPTLCGLKNSSRELYDMATTTRLYEDKFQMLTGAADYLGTLEVGVKLAVSNHVFAPAHRNISAALENGDREKAIMWDKRVKSVYAVRKKHGGSFGVSKAMMCVMGIDVGPVRPPYVSPSLRTSQQMADDIKETGFFDWSQT